MTTPSGTSFTGPTTVEDVMAALAHQSIFDLPALAQKLVTATAQHAGDEDDPVEYDLLISPNYVLQHVKSAAVDEMQ